MSDPGVLGAVGHVVELWSAALALNSLRLDADPQLPPGIRVFAGLLDDAVHRATAAVDRALEVDTAGVRMPVTRVPVPGSAHDLDLLREPQPVWTSLRSLIDACDGFVRTVDLTPLTGRDATWIGAATGRVRTALDAIDLHHQAADRFLSAGRPFFVMPRPHGPDAGPEHPTPSPGGLADGERRTPPTSAPAEASSRTSADLASRVTGASLLRGSSAAVRARRGPAIRGL